VPGARPDSITPDIAERARCAVIAPGANVPYGAGAIEVLHRRGIVAVPDFVANSGGVHLYVSVGDAGSPPAALAAIEDIVRAAVAKTLATADERGIPPFAAALDEARAYLSRTTRASSELLDELFAPAG